MAVMQVPGVQCGVGSGCFSHCPEALPSDTASGTGRVAATALYTCFSASEDALNGGSQIPARQGLCVNSLGEPADHPYSSRT